jgi:hypothetical protein
LTLPAHRFEDRKKNDDGPPYIHVFDYDETITGAPDQLARVATGLKALGDRVVIVTGNTSDRADIVKQLADFGFPFDDLIQYDDTASNGLRRAEILKQLNAWLGFDNRVDRSYTYAKICPHLYLIAKPTSENKDDAKGAKKGAKKAVKDARSDQVADVVVLHPLKDAAFLDRNGDNYQLARHELVETDQ